MSFPPVAAETSAEDGRCLDDNFFDRWNMSHEARQNPDLIDDPFHLDRFVAAQAGAYETALAEIRRGAKRSHWMWFIFPQISGLGHSPMAQRYAIGSLDEARAYLAHPVLGNRLRACVEALQDLTAERLGIEGAAIKVLERSHHSAAGWLALARVFGGPLTDGLELMSADGQTVRAGTLFGVQGRITTKLGRAEPGDIVAIAKAEAMETGQIFGIAGAAPTTVAAITRPVTN